MVQRPSLLVKQPVRAAASRYGITLLSVLAAFLAVFMLRRFQARGPFASVFLSEIAVSVLYGGDRSPAFLPWCSLRPRFSSFSTLRAAGPRVAASRSLGISTFLIVGVAISQFNRRLERAEHSLVYLTKDSV